MRREAEMWWKQALRDLEAAKKILKLGNTILRLFLHNKQLKKHIAGEVPYELYDEDIAKEKIDGAAKVIEWVKKNL